MRSSGGVFEVTVDNEVLFSKKKSGRFPVPGEVEEKLSSRAEALPS